MSLTYRHTRRACYNAYITQAIVNNLAPLLFVLFQDQFSLSFEEVGRLVLLNFGVQLFADILSVRYVDRLGYRRSAMLAHVFCALGLCALSLLPRLLPDPYLGLVLAVVIYALGGGLLEVLVSPIVDSLPGEEKEAAMSLLHSFYCWGQVAVVLITTLLIRFWGENFWPVLPLLWSLVPLGNLLLFSRVPLAPIVGQDEAMGIGKLLHSPIFLLALLMMLSSGASELSMSQWSSLFAERGLGVPKLMGDLLGPCLFAILMGTGRALYGVFGSRLKLTLALPLCGGLCICCYLLTVFSPFPLLSLAGCALCGLSVSLMWPGTFSLAAARFPYGGTALFGLLAVFGDLGASLGPWLTGAVSDLSQNLPVIQRLASEGSLPISDLSQIGLRCGLLAAAIFPALLFLGSLLFSHCQAKEEDIHEP